jgi:hypothetical protein
MQELLLQRHQVVDWRRSDLAVERQAPEVDLLDRIPGVGPEVGLLAPEVAEREYAVREHEVRVASDRLLARGAAVAVGRKRFYQIPSALVVVLEHHCSEDDRVLGVPVPVERPRRDVQQACRFGDVHIVGHDDVHHVPRAVAGLFAAGALVARDAGEDGLWEAGELLSLLEGAGEELEAVRPEGRAACEQLSVFLVHALDECGVEGLSFGERDVDHLLDGGGVCRLGRRGGGDDQPEEGDHQCGERQEARRNDVVLHGVCSFPLHERGEVMC